MKKLKKYLKVAWVLAWAPVYFVAAAVMVLSMLAIDGPKSAHELWEDVV